jgi:hypothetical protein
MRASNHWYFEGGRLLCLLFGGQLLPAVETVVEVGGVVGVATGAGKSLFLWKTIHHLRVLYITMNEPAILLWLYQSNKKSADPGRRFFYCFL